MLINNSQLNSSEITSYLHKVRVIMFDKTGKFLVTDMDGSYNFPGGRVEDGESSLNALIREIKEEIGVKVFIHDVSLIGNYHFYHKDFPDGTNRNNEIDLYVLNKPTTYDYKNINITEYEKSFNFKIVSISEEGLKNLLKEPSNNVYKKFTDIELQVLFDEYKKYKGGNKNVR